MKLPKIKLRKQKPSLPPRITNETVAEHRERILAGGRRFKYPIQYGRRRLVINAILIGLATLVLTVAIGWWQLYIVQNTGNFMYQVTKVIPVPVAKVDGQFVRYSDYLMQYRSNIHLAEARPETGIILTGEDGEKQRDYFKRMTLNNAITDGYAKKVAEDLDISVSDEEVQALFNEHRIASNGQELSRAAYSATINETYGWSEDEYLRILERQLLRQKVSLAIDNEAGELKDELAAKLKSDGSNFEEVASQYEDRVELAAPGKVPRTNADGGLSQLAASLEPGKVSEAFVSRGIDGYYFVKLLEKTDKDVNYLSIKVPLTEFTSRLEKAQKQDGFKEYIKVPNVEAQRSQED